MDRLARATTLQQKDARPPIADQSRSGDPTGRAPANHNKIEVVGHSRFPVAKPHAVGFLTGAPYGGWGVSSQAKLLRNLAD